MKKLTKKLSLNKQTVATLKDEKLNQVMGGYYWTNACMFSYECSVFIEICDTEGDCPKSMNFDCIKKTQEFCIKA